MREQPGNIKREALGNTSLFIWYFATKKHYYLCFALLNFTYSGAKTLIS